MGLFSFFRKDKQQSSAGNSDFYSQADEERPAARKRRQGTKRDEPVDPVLPEKKRARRRLVGAIALVLAAVIGLPMILDSEPKPLSSDIAIQIPSKDAAPSVAPVKPASDKKPAEPAAETLSANEEVVEATTPAAPATSSKETVVAAPTAPVAAPTQTPAPTVKPTTPPATAAHDTAKKPHTDTAKTDDAKAAAAAQSAKKADDARARAILEGKVADNAAAKPSTSTKVALQVAALASQDKVTELQKKLQSAGLKSYTQKVATESGERIRVRVGPFANDAEAEKARAKLGTLGLTGKLVPA